MDQSDPTGKAEPADDRRRWTRQSVWILTVQTLIVTVLLGWLAWSAPITYDEAFNWITYRTIGLLEIATNYDVPNNHVPYTLLQSVLPRRLVTWDPWTIRITAVAISVALLAILAVVSMRRTRNPALALMIVVGSPLLMSYMVISRSYTLSGLLAVVVAINTALGRIWVPTRIRPGADTWLGRHQGELAAAFSALLLGLASWATALNGFVVPGWVLIVLLTDGWRRAVLASSAYVVVTSLLLFPIVGDVLEQSRVQWAFDPWTITNLHTRVSFVPVVTLVVVAIVGAVGLDRARRIGWRRVHDVSTLGRVALAAAVMAASWFVILPIALFAGMQTPFYRNAVPVVWLVVLAVVAGFPVGRLGRWLSIALVVPMIVGLVFVVEAVNGGRWDRLEGVLAATTPATIRELDSDAAQLLVCGSFDAPVCQLVADLLDRRGVGFVLSDDPLPPDISCAVGSTRPPEPFRSYIIADGVVVGLVCH